MPTATHPGRRRGVESLLSWLHGRIPAFIAEWLFLVRMVLERVGVLPDLCLALLEDLPLLR
jgi:hypothetical protein